jgi:hypothetical protein
VCVTRADRHETHAASRNERSTTASDDAITTVGAARFRAGGTQGPNVVATPAARRAITVDAAGVDAA